MEARDQLRNNKGNEEYRQVFNQYDEGQKGYLTLKEYIKFQIDIAIQVKRDPLGEIITSTEENFLSTFNNQFTFDQPGKRNFVNVYFNHLLEKLKFEEMTEEDRQAAHNKLVEKVDQLIEEELGILENLTPDDADDDDDKKYLKQTQNNLDWFRYAKSLL